MFPSDHKHIQHFSKEKCCFWSWMTGWAEAQEEKTWANAMMENYPRGSMESILNIWDDVTLIPLWRYHMMLSACSWFYMMSGVQQDRCSGDLNHVSTHVLDIWMPCSIRSTTAIIQGRKVCSLQQETSHFSSQRTISRSSCCLIQHNILIVCHCF